MNFFRDLKRLGSVLDHIESLPKGSCLYISSGIEEVDASTLCLPIALDKEDPKDVEWFLKGDALQEFLFATDLEDVIENLRLQQGTYSEAELIAAVNYYWKNDAFIKAAI
jgi:hypothetical protein